MGPPRGSHSSIITIGEVAALMILRTSHHDTASNESVSPCANSNPWYFHSIIRPSPIHGILDTQSKYYDPWHYGYEVQITVANPIVEQIIRLEGPCKNLGTANLPLLLQRRSILRWA